jgi:integrase
MIFIALLLGLRASEILGLRWDDFDMKRRIMRINRSRVGQHTGDTKTEGSEVRATKPQPSSREDPRPSWRCTERTHRRPGASPTRSRLCD